MLYLNQKSKTPAEDYTLENKKQGFIKHRKYQESIYVLGDALTDTTDMVRATSGLPKLYEAGVQGCYCVGISPKEVATVINPLTGLPCSLWEVDIRWDSDLGTDTSPGDGSGGDSSTPDSRPPQYRWTSRVEEIFPNEDLMGAVMATPTGEPITLARKITIPVLEIHRNEHFPFDPQVILDYQNTTNMESFWLAPAYSALMDSIDTDLPIVEAGIVYVPVTYNIAFKFLRFINTAAPGHNPLNPATWTYTLQPTTSIGSWQDKVLCKGLYYYDTAEYDAWVAAGSIAANKPKSRPYANLQTDWNIKEVFLEAATGKVLADQTNPEYQRFTNVVAKSWSALSIQPWWWTTTTTTT
jgi:hypothetical protein